MDDVFGKIIAAIVVLSAVVFDWPRALAGLAVGYMGRKSGYPKLAIPLGVLGVAGIGELIYSLIGRTAGMSWSSFTFGAIAAGATAFGLFRVLWGIAGDVRG